MFKTCCILSSLDQFNLKHYFKRYFFTHSLQYLDPNGADQFCATHLNEKSNKNSKLKSSNNKELSVLFESRKRSQATYSKSSFPAKEQCTKLLNNQEKLELLSSSQDLQSEPFSNLISCFKALKVLKQNYSKRLS